jgi:hypothetical protein
VKKRLVLAAAGLGAAAVLLLALLSWKDAVVAYRLHRLRGNPKLQEEYLARPEDSPEELAVIAMEDVSLGGTIKGQIDLLHPGSWKRRSIPIAIDSDRPAVAWTGKELFVWGGSRQGDPPVRGVLVDPAMGTARPIPAAGGPEPRSHAVCAWTGKEVLIVGGCRDDEDLWFTDAWAFEPATLTWRRLENYPRARP